MTISREELLKLGEPRKLTVEEKKEHKSKSNEKYEKKHKKERKRYHAKYYETHKEEIGNNERTYRQKHQEERKAYGRKYGKIRKERHLFLGGFGEEGFSINLIQIVGKHGKVYGIGFFTNVQTPKEKRRHNFKNITVLNEWFEGSVLHHLTKDVAVFIPKGLHQSISHNLETGKNMDLINEKALTFVGKQKSKCGVKHKC